MRIEVLTPLEALEPFFHLFLAFLPLFQLVDLYLLPKLLSFPLLSLCVALLYAGRLIKQPLPYAFHMGIRLDHLGKVVGGPCERETVLRCKSTGCVCPV